MPVTDLLIKASEPPKQLLSVVEVGGYADFSALYARLGYTATVVRSARKAKKWLKKRHFDAVIIEFNPQANFFFRDRASNVESLLTSLNPQTETKIIVFYEMQHAEEISQLHQRFAYFSALAYPIDVNQLEAKLVSYIN